MTQLLMHRKTEEDLLRIGMRLVESVFALYPVDSEGDTLENVLTLAVTYDTFDEQLAFLLKHVICVDDISELTLMDYHIPQHIIDAASLMKKFPQHTYVEYVESLLDNPLASRVMNQYWSHYSQLSNYPISITDDHIRRTMVYKRALELTSSQKNYQIFGRVPIEVRQ